MSLFDNPSRRDALRVGLLAGAGLAFGRLPNLHADVLQEQQELPLITKPMPS